jgi:hypothetical protein
MKLKTRFNVQSGLHHSTIYIKQYPKMRQFMWQDDTASVVRFVAECLDILQSAVAASHQP